MQRLIEKPPGEFRMRLTTAYLEVVSWGAERILIFVKYMTLEPRTNNNNCCRCRRLSRVNEIKHQSPVFNTIKEDSLLGVHHVVGGTPCEP